MRKFFLGLVLTLFTAQVFAATAYITEFQRNPTVTYQAAITPALANQAIAISASSSQSAAFTSATTMIRVHCDADCWLSIGGTNPTATTSMLPLAAGETEYFLVTPGDKLAVIGM